MSKENVIEKLTEVIKLEKEIKELTEKFENLITEDELCSHFSYSDKEYLLKIREQIDSYHVKNKFSRALKNMKEVAYPEIKGVKYYKKYIDQLTTPLSEDEKKSLDDILCENARPQYVMCNLNKTIIPYQKHHDVIQELWKMGLVSLTTHCYFDCECYNSDGVRLVKVKYGQSIYDYFKVENDEELLSRIQEEVYCDECGETLEEKDLEDFKEQFKDVNSYYHVEVEPDRTLDNL